MPAYFTDAQRQATRDAGVLAGLDVVRILNEPTAAALAYGFGEGDVTKAMVYDLGGGTFDVSIVQVEGDVTEVLSSHGNNHLGGDDLDHKLVELLAATFLEEHDVDLLHGHPLASFFDSAEAYDGVDAESVVDAEFSEVVEDDNLAAPSTGSRLGDLEHQAHALVERSRASFDKMHGEDKEEAIDLHVRISEAIAIGDREALEEAVSTLKELLFFVEGR